MGLTIGPYDPVYLIFSLINTLMKKKYLTYNEAKEIIRQSLSPDMSKEEKDKLIKSLFIKIDKNQKNNGS